MVTIKSIKNDADLDNAVARIRELLDNEAGIQDDEELNILLDLVEHYESKKYPIEMPDPISAIEFRMDQAGLTQADLVPYIGSRSKVSEVLSGKRDLTMSMARALHKHLGIPADVLLQERAASFDDSLEGIDFERFPLRTMAKRGWIENVTHLKDHAEELVCGLIDQAGGLKVASNPFYRKNDQRRVNAKTDSYSLQAWCWKVMASANEDGGIRRCEYDQDSVDINFLKEVARLSSKADGPRLAKTFLAENGIALIIVPHLPKTHLDGAALRLADGRPVVGLTLRYDRIDNFWFTLMHELAHVGRHGDIEDNQFVDDMTLRNVKGIAEDSTEIEADEWAEDALIPKDVWANSIVRDDPTPMSVIQLATWLEIHPAIVAGRVRYERGNYRLLSQFVGSGQIRKHFDLNDNGRKSDEQ